MFQTASVVPVAPVAYVALIQPLRALVRHWRHLVTLSWLCLLCLSAAAVQAGTDTLRVGVLKFGTVQWQLDVITAHQLEQKYHFQMQVVPLASADAANVALQGGAVDLIVSDWIWVNRQRAEGTPYTFVPFSNAVGALMVAGDSPMNSLADLRGKSVGVAGGAYDKSWLLLRAYALKQLGADLTQVARPVYAAAPLLNELALSGQVDAVLNVWHYDARLQARGMRPLLKLSDVLAGLGVRTPIPLLGWVFNDRWARAHPGLMEGFLAASAQAQAVLAESDAEWERLRPLLHAEDPATFAALRSGYRSGIIHCTDADALQGVAQTLRILADTGGEKLVGKSASLSEGTFWPGYRFASCPRK